MTMYKKEHLAKLKKMDNLAPEVMKAFWAFDRAAVASCGDGFGLLFSSSAEAMSGISQDVTVEIDIEAVRQ